MSDIFFDYEMPCGKFRTLTKLDEENKITFDPPVYEQRYCAAIQILEDQRWTKEIKKIVDFGCAEMKFLPLLRRVEHVEHILEVDIDANLLENKLHAADPLTSDFLSKRPRPLRIDVVQGSIAEAAEELLHTDAVVCLELIEHVCKDVLDAIPHNIFGFMQVKLAIFSTPNSEFNVLFQPLHANGFRHIDHKFEWTREEFSQWCKQICILYPNYKVSTDLGVGDPPAGKEKLGHVSQFAIFVRRDLLGLPLIQQKDNSDVVAAPLRSNAYKTLHTAIYPHFVDTRSTREKIYDEIKCQLYHRPSEPFEYDGTDLFYRIPISTIMQCIEPLGGTEQMLREMIDNEPDAVIELDMVLVNDNCENNLHSDSDCEIMNSDDDQSNNPDTDQESDWN